MNHLLLQSLLPTFAVGMLALCLTGHTPCSADDSKEESAENAKETSEVEVPYTPKSKVQLRRQLSSMQYRVTQQEDTEPAFQNRYWNNKQKGTYRCVVCNQLLFDSDTKFKSGTGWPSFWAPAKKTAVGYREDNKFFYTRIEVHCKRCKAHLGHVFDDGPANKTGKRYCMNSASLKFRTRDQEAKLIAITKAAQEKDSQEKPNEKAPNEKFSEQPAKEE